MNRYLGTTEKLLIVAACTAALAATLHYTGLHWLFGYLAAVNSVTFCTYLHDKRQAVKKASRIPEFILHLLALVGGSPAALIAQITFRHKTRKLSFKMTFLAIVLTQVALIIIFYLHRF